MLGIFYIKSSNFKAIYIILPKTDFSGAASREQLERLRNDLNKDAASEGAGTTLAHPEPDPETSQ